MKRSHLARREFGLRRRSKPPLPAEEFKARVAWKEPHQGWCECGCGRFSMHLERHHVCYQQHVRAEGGDMWDLRNSMMLHPLCHAHHHSGRRRICVERLPVPALIFMADLFGDARSSEYLRRYYDCAVAA